MAMAVVEATPRVRDADDRTREGRRRVAHGSRERAPEIEREVSIAVVGEPPRQSFAHRPSRPSRSVHALIAASCLDPNRSPTSYRAPSRYRLIAHLHVTARRHGLRAPWPCIAHRVLAAYRGCARRSRALF